MEFKQGTGNVQIFVKPRQNGIVIPMATWTAQYGENTPTNGTYSLLAETADKTDSITIASSSIDANGMFFTLPSTMFENSQVNWTVILRFTLQSITDHSLYNFNIKVSKGDSVNSR